MASSQNQLAAAIAVTRFGMGARPGEIDAVAADPRAWLRAQIRPEGGDQPAPLLGAWPDARDRLIALMGYRDQLKTIRADLGLPKKAGAVLTPDVSPSAVIAPSMSPSGMSAMAPLPAPTGNGQQLTPAAPARALDARTDFIAARRAAKQPLDDESNAETLARFQLACATPAGFRERWTLFWSNHFTVAGKNEEMQTLAPVFEREAIRPHVFGRFEDLLLASTTHQGMLFYLDQVRSAGPDSVVGMRRKLGLNENLAREIMELHTVGAAAGYTQADVTEFARALTGLTVGDGRPNGGEQGAVLFRADFHEPGARLVMNRTYVGDGPEPARRILADLASDPRTARRLGRKIATHFVSDTPPPALCARLEQAYLAGHGDLGRVAEALIVSPEAWVPQPLKLKTPYEFLVSIWRAANLQPGDVRKDVLNPLNALGHRPFYAAQPNGWADDAATWGAPDAMIKRLSIAQQFGAAHAPLSDPSDVARQALGARLTPAAAQAIARAESRPEAFALLVMTPEFQRR